MSQCIAVGWIWIGLISLVFARRELYDSKCKRTCNTEKGSFDCWKATTDGFTYGLATAMIDFCETILKIRNVTSDQEAWYDISRDILAKQIEQYDLDGDVQQLSKEDITKIAISLLDQCFNTSSPMSPSEASCSFCSAEQTKKIQQWRLSSIILISIALCLVLLTLLLYFLQVYHIRRSYILIK